MHTAPLSQGASAALMLELQNAQHDLQQLVYERNGLLAAADVEFALAAESSASRVQHNTKAASLRLKAFTLDGQLHNLRLKVRNLESQLKSAPAQVAPVVLTAEQLAAVDDCAGLLA